MEQRYLLVAVGGGTGKERRGEKMGKEGEGGCCCHGGDSGK